MPEDQDATSGGRPLLVVALLVAFCAGLVVGLFLRPTGPEFHGTRDTAPPDADRAIAPAAARDATAAAPSRRGTETGPEDAPPERSGRVPPSPGASRPVVGRIEGAVVTADGAPLASVRIVAQPQPPDDVRARSLGQDPDLTTEEILAATREREAIRRGALGEAVTGADGRFEIETHADVLHDVRASLEGYRIRARPSVVRPDGFIAFLAEPVHVLTLDVRLPDGGEPDEASVRFETSNGRRVTRTWTPHERSVEAPDGTWDVAVAVGRDRALTSETVERTFATGERSSMAITVGTEPALALSVPREPLRVIAPHVTVWVRRADDGATVTPGGLRAEGRRIEVRPGVSFRNVLHDVAPGVYAVGATRRTDGTLETFEHVRVGSWLTRHEIPLPAPAREDYLVVRVLTEHGAPFSSDLHIRVSQGSATSGGRRGEGCVLLPDGTLAVRHPEPWYAGTSDGPFRVDVRYRTSSAGSAEYVRGPAPTVDVVLGAPPELDVLVEGVVGTRHEGRVRVELVPDEGVTPRMYVARQAPGPDSEGRIRLAAKVPGAHWLLVAVVTPVRGQNPTAVTWKRLTLAPGRNEATVRLPDLGTLRIEGLDRPAEISLVALPEWRREVFVGEDGAIDVPELPPGRYVVKPYGSTHEPVTIEFPATDVVEF